MADERAAYPDSSRRSEQLSCRKYFHPSYRLKDMIFQRFKSFYDFNYLFNLNISKTVSDDVGMTSE